MHRPSPLASTLVLTLVAIVLVLAGWWWRQSSAEPVLVPVPDAVAQSDRPDGVPAAQPPPSDTAMSAKSRDSAAVPASEGQEPSPLPQPRPSAEYDAAEIRAAILAKHRPSAEDHGPTPSPSATGQLNKRVEGHDVLFAELQTDFMPLADECIEQAQARDESLEGMLALSLELLVDDELGTIVETIEFPTETNEIEDAELHTCMRESLLSMILPPEAESGRTTLMLTLPIEP